MKLYGPCVRARISLVSFGIPPSPPPLFNPRPRSPYLSLYKQADFKLKRDTSKRGMLVFRGIRRNYVREWRADSRKLTKKKWKTERSILLPFPGPRLAKQSPGKLYFHRLDGRPVHASIEYFFLSLRISSFFYFPFEMKDDSFVYIRCFNKF